MKIGIWNGIGRMIKQVVWATKKVCRHVMANEKKNTLVSLHYFTLVTSFLPDVAVNFFFVYMYKSAICYFLPIYIFNYFWKIKMH